MGMNFQRGLLLARYETTTNLSPGAATRLQLADWYHFSASLTLSMTPCRQPSSQVRPPLYGALLAQAVSEAGVAVVDKSETN